MNPKHIYPVPEGREALAPYNFVPLPEQIVRAEPLPDQDRYAPDDGPTPRYTGRIRCLLKTWSPLYVRCGYTPADFADHGGKPFSELSPEQQRRRGQFFHHDRVEEPVIPGSSLRGLLRTLVEIAGYGKVEQVSKRGLVYRAVGERESQVAGQRTLGDFYRERLMRKSSPGSRSYTLLMQAGYIQHSGGQWSIRPAQTIQGTTFGRIERTAIPAPLPSKGAARNADRIWIIPGACSYQNVRGGFLQVQFAPVARAAATPAAGLIEATLARSGPMPGKRWEAVVYPPDAVADLIPIDDEMITAYREQLSKEQRKLLGDNGVLVPDQPVFYLIENGTLAFFGHTMMFRIPYQHVPHDFVPVSLPKPEEGASSSQVSAHDLAEAIFGYVQDNPSDPARAGRVFVGDARWDRTHSEPTRRVTPWLAPEPFVPPILSGPKPTTFQHYLTQDSAAHEGLHHYAERPGVDTAIRGHKLYWHRGNPDGAALTDRAFAQQPAHKQAQDTQHTCFKPVADGVAFVFDLHFENLSQVELGALLWVLRTANDPRYRLALGMGKPFGMGAVSIAPEVYRTHRAERYRALFTGEQWELAEQLLEDATADSCVQAFERYVIQYSGEQAARLEETLRIQCLLLLLGWQGPDRTKTRYLEIERDERKGYAAGRPRYDQNKDHKVVNEYAERPVLPWPQQVYPSAVREWGFMLPTNRTAAQAPSEPEPVRPSSPLRPLPDKGERIQASTSGDIVLKVDGRTLNGLRVQFDTRPYRIPRGFSVEGFMRRQDAVGLNEKRFTAEVLGQLEDPNKRKIYLLVRLADA
ncbi:MAG TPA: TIGR03986 family CRISPR-associated RAMP protein [Roseiflexaceae bacterium]|nr:TIGR03986 family CRISPR-associated RAMP protein [Roseiflexaceae bacterium]